MVVYDYIAGEAYVPTKVKLHDPAGEGAKSLYPVTVLGAIVAGLDTEDALATNIANQSNQIKYKYLEPFYQSGNQGKIYNDYLNIAFTAGTNKIDSSSLNIFNGEGKIMSDLLPSFVDDVVEVPVLGGTGYPDANLFIRVGENDQGVTTYTFYTKGDNNNWVIGGGETGKIYIAATTGGVGDGSIYRCVTGSTSTAIKISENPYAIDQTATNGVSLSTDNGNLKAVADSATYGRFGTVRISNAATNNVALTCTDGIVAVSAGVGAATLPGVVYAVANQTEIDFINENVGAGALAYTVPTAGYMQSYVSSVLTGIDFATSSIPGIVQIGSNIDVGASGLISVNSAASERYGVVKIIDTIADTAAGNTGNTDKAVTLGGISSYIDRKVAGYQKVLLEGPGINITATNTGDVISVDAEAPLTFTNDILAGNQKLTINDATTGARGVVIYTGDYAAIEDSIVSDANGHPIVVNAKAVHDYVQNLVAGCPIPTDSERGGIRISAAQTGLSLTGNPGDILKINRTAPLYVDDNNNLAISSGTLAGSGAVNVVSTGAQMETEDYATYVPQNQAVLDYIAGLTFGTTYEFTSGTTEINGVVKAVVNATTYPWMVLDANGIGVSSATDSGYGVAALAIDATAIGTVTAANSTYVPTVKAVSGYLATNYQPKGTYQSALSFESGVTSANNTVKAVVDSATYSWMILGANGIGVSSAVDAGYGVVALATTSGGISSFNTTTSKYVPTVKAVSGYLATNYQPKGTYQSALSFESGVTSANNTVKAVVNATTYPWMVLGANGIGVSSAMDGGYGVVALATTSGGISSFDAATSNYVPTVKAVKGFVSTYVAEAGAQGALTEGPGIWIGDVTEGAVTTSNVISARVYDGSGGITFDENNLVLRSAAYVDTSNGSAHNDTFVPLGGVRVYSGGGLLVNNGVMALAVGSGSLGGVIVPTTASTSSGVRVDASGNLKLNAATAQYLGGIRLADTMTGLAVSAGEILRIDATLPLDIDANNKLIVSKAAGVTSSGVVTVLSNTTQINAYSATTAAVPNAAGLIDYVSSAITGTDIVTLDGDGLYWSGTTLNAGATYPLVAAADAIGVHTAAAEHGTTLTSGALGVVYVRDAIRTEATISAGTLEANTVPNEMAVRKLVDSTSTSIITEMDNRMYITYTAV